MEVRPAVPVSGVRLTGEALEERFLLGFGAGRGGSLSWPGGRDNLFCRWFGGGVATGRGFADTVAKQAFPVVAGCLRGASRREERSVGRVRFSRSPRARLAQLVVAGVVASAGVLAFGAGSAFANGSYACTGVAAIDTPGLQGDINTGGTVTVFGP